MIICYPPFRTLASNTVVCYHCRKILSLMVFVKGFTSIFFYICLLSSSILVLNNKRVALIFKYPKHSSNFIFINKSQLEIEQILFLTQKADLMYFTTRVPGKSDTRATQVWEECDTNSTSATWTTRLRHEWNILILITTRVKRYFHIPILAIWQIKYYK